MPLAMQRASGCMLPRTVDPTPASTGRALDWGGGEGRRMLLPLVLVLAVCVLLWKLFDTERWDAMQY